MNTPEILAPAGSMDCVIAAVRCGADAVYLGGKAFNARRNASNFEEDEFARAVEYCHGHGVKVYQVLNTLVSDREIPAVLKEVQRACAFGVDALILQDWGLIALVGEAAPEIPVHGSTQLSVQTPEGFLALEKQGMKRAVLPRELSWEEIRAIRSATKMELECFVHGALCMSVSGQCELSAMLGGRSGNRGLCAQPCRLPFSAAEPGGCDLSLKDLSLVEEIPELSRLGVSSLKIEGRMKRPEYVAAAVTACRQARDGRLEPELKRDLQRVFSRSGFTKGYFEAKLGKEMFGIRQKEDVLESNEVQKQFSRLYDREIPRIPVDFFFTCKRGQPLALTVSAQGKTASLCSEEQPETAQRIPLTLEKLRERLGKCGGTPFFLRSLHADLEEGLIASASALNTLRRDALSQLEQALKKKEPWRYDPPEFHPEVSKKSRTPYLTARFQTAGQVPESASRCHRMTLPAEAPEKDFEQLLSYGRPVGAELPRGIFDKFPLLLERLKQLRTIGVSFVLAGTLDGVILGQKAGMSILGDFGLNCFNSRSLSFLESLGVEQPILSMELNRNQIAGFSGQGERGILAYGALPLMLARNCPVKPRLGCAACGGNGVLHDRKGETFPVSCRFGVAEVFNSRPLYLADRIGELENIDFLQLYFTRETQAECHRIIRDYFYGKAPEGTFTRGLLYRGVE